ncbi:hypothetical protein HanRHA438_Chr14g0647271 [Helianthus annuus]|nr:hypothetical protein HanRHA438_Chr14g0647271 [Helianthus annuus]
MLHRKYCMVKSEFVVQITNDFGCLGKEIAAASQELGSNEYKNKLMQVIILTSCWVIWKARNDTIFAGRRANVDALFGELQTLSFLWIKHCSRDYGLTWEKWVSFNFS